VEALTEVGEWKEKEQVGCGPVVTHGERKRGGVDRAWCTGLKAGQGWGGGTSSGMSGWGPDQATRQGANDACARGCLLYGENGGVWASPRVRKGSAQDEQCCFEIIEKN
jgi:hypothetical protein